MKVLQEPGNKQLVQKMELDHIADRRLPANKQTYRDIEDDLLFVLDEKGHSVHLTDQGVEFMSPQRARRVRAAGSLAGGASHRSRSRADAPKQKIEARRQIEIDYASKSERLNIVHQLLRAHALYDRDVNYVVQDGEVLIVDEFTGRTMPGRRWSEGLHQAVEAKEGVRVKGETQTMATITIQNYFRMYDKLAGMTGTAETEETEFFQIYKLEVAVIPTNQPMVREDRHDLVYKTRREKYNAIVEETRRLHDLGFPVLIGTTSVEASETLAKMFSRGGIAAQRAEREVPPARGRNRRGRGTAGRGHDRDEHGRPRYRHQTRRRREGSEAVEGEGSGRQRDQRDGDRRSPHHRLRASRVTPHRPPVARTIRSSGRSGFVAVLPVARR